MNCGKHQTALAAANLEASSKPFRPYENYNSPLFSCPALILSLLLRIIRAFLPLTRRKPIPAIADLRRLGA